ncbi:uncharacterized protein G2W53_037054 [Senna tora]|uniref:Uncharacterized protein n=1 Tax=Senna tora TaxID=362788 RepID=A0A834SV39_9FABA|nr:uncharacterized protein G2W53_037054 [Senna tora]
MEAEIVEVERESEKSKKRGLQIRGENISKNLNSAPNQAIRTEQQNRNNRGPSGDETATDTDDETLAHWQ